VNSGVVALTCIGLFLAVGYFGFVALIAVAVVVALVAGAYLAGRRDQRRATRRAVL
jgi:Cu/Ag efflux pump CusA